MTSTSNDGHEHKCSRIFWTEIEIFLYKKQIHITLYYISIFLYHKITQNEDFIIFTSIKLRIDLYKIFYLNKKYAKTIPMFENFLKYLIKSILKTWIK